MMDESKNQILIEQIADPEEDTFNYKDICKSVADTIITDKPPFVYAICGSWGTGKSSFLNFMVDHLISPSDQNQPTDNKEKRRVVTYFNAWKASLHSDILFAFVYEIFTQLSESDAIKHSSIKKGLLNKCIETITTETAKVLGEIKPLRPLHSTYRRSLSFLDLNMIEVMKGAESTRASFEDICRFLKEEITVYVIIDELDRCRPTDVVKIIESIRMLFLYPDRLEQKIKIANGILKQDEQLEIPFKYIISFDEKYVAKAFREYYKLDSMEEAFEYISKFVQFKYHFTKRKFTEYIKSLIGNYSHNMCYFPKDSENDLANIISKLNIKHPREVRWITVYLIEWQKRLFNDPLGSEDLKFYKKIVKKFKKKNDQYLVLRTINCYLFLTACIKVHFPERYDEIVQKDLIQQLPDINSEKGSIANSVIFKLFRGEKLAPNTNYPPADLEKEEKLLGKSRVTCLKLLWDAVETIDQNTITIKGQELTFAKFIHEPKKYSNFIKDLLKIVFDN